MFKLIYTGEKSKIDEKEINKIFLYLKNSFNIDIPTLYIHIFDTRQEFNKEIKRDTPEWLVANASNNNLINILSPFAFEKESSHKKKEFIQVLTHEISHLFIHELSMGNAVPKWLNEGLASYFAGQHKDKKEVIYIEEDFCKKLGTPRGWNDNVNYDAYTIASRFVSFLIKEYSFNKIRELITLLNKNYNYSNFKDIFFEVYKKDLSEMEMLFIKDINK